MIGDVNSQILSHPFACGWKDGHGPTSLAWGSESKCAAPNLQLSFRSFHYPEKERPGVWNNFPLSGVCAPENFLRLEKFPAPPSPLRALGAFQETPSRSEWGAFCQKINDAIEEGRLKKVVPSRHRHFPLEESDRAALLSELLPRLFGPSQDGTFRFFLKWNNAWFFGATPELLFRRQGDSWMVPAIAGTRVAPQDESAAAAVEAELLSNPKELAEHEFVVRGIKESLTTLGLRPTSPAQPTILRLRGLIHLHTPILAPAMAVGAEDLLSALHPTAAVGGYPQRPAKNFLRHQEPGSRGLFASPLLVRSQGEELCLVGIRSGLIDESGLHLFAGAGYVKGSEAESEWNETGKKMDFLRRLLEEEQK